MFVYFKKIYIYINNLINFLSRFTYIVFKITKCKNKTKNVKPKLKIIYNKMTLITK